MCISQLQISLQCHHLQQNPSLGWYLQYLEKKKIKLNLSGGNRHKRVKKISRGTKMVPCPPAMYKHGFSLVSTQEGGWKL